MKILNKLSIKNLKLNKKRTISTIIGIILSVALICAVATMGTSFQRTLVERTISETGYYHVKISNVTEENIKDIKNNRDVGHTYQVQDIGYSKLEGSQNENKPYLHLYSMENDSFTKLKFKIKEGQFPTNNNEIVISDHIISNAKVDLKVGDEVTLGIGKRMLEGQELDDSNFYSTYEENYNPDGTVTKKKYIEDFEVANTKTFKIVGIIERPNSDFEDRGAPGYTIITTNMNEGKKNIYAELLRPQKYKTSIPELLGVNNWDELSIATAEGNLKYDKWQTNQELLRWEAFAFSDSTINMLYSVIGVVLVIIVFTSVFCIRNSFAIATTEKIKMYGMLSSVGATKKQIKKNVIFEGMILGLIGIPLGILSGLFAVFVLLKIVNALLGDFLFGYEGGMVFDVSIMPIVISIVLGFITIDLSAISSARKASKVSPIEQLRNSKDIKIKNRKLKTPKIISKIFKTGGVLAYKNLKRSKKKYRTTVISIAVSIFIFITMNAFLTNAFALAGNYYKDYDYNFKIYNGLDKLAEDEVDKILKLEGIEESFLLYENRKSPLRIKDLSKIEHMGKDEVGEYSDLMLIALDNASFKKYCKKIGADYEKVKISGILCDTYQEYDAQTGNVTEVRRYNYSKNDTITGFYNDKEVDIKVGEITPIKPFGMEQIFYDGGYLIVNIDEFKQFDFTLDQISINSSDPDKLQEDITKMGKNLDVLNVAADVKAQKAMILVIKIFLYGFIAVITLIGVTNIFNTITSNMELRQKEFAMLKSVGMTKKEFNRMINLETLFYGTKSLIYGIILGLLGTFAMYKAFSMKIDSGVYIPVIPIILSVVFVFVLIFIIMRYSIAKINKQNTIETIRKDNI